jgi:hypothetical protein
MKSHELAKILLENPDVELICQKDSEGNGYSPLSGVDFEVVYVQDEDNSWYGECYDINWEAEDACMTKKEWASLKKKLKNKYAVLYPVN